MKQCICFSLILLSSLSSWALQQPTTEFKDAVRLLDQWLDAQVAFDNLPGISVGIVKDQQLVWSKGFGMADIDKNIPAQANTIYSICSISKLFTSIAIMQLCDAGKLRLDDEVAAILPWFKIKQSYVDSGPITIRTLLTHSSGLPREADFPYWSDGNFPTKQQVIEKLKEQQTLSPTATYSHYSNLGMALLGFIVEEKSGIPYGRYVNDNVLKPLRLNDTRTYFPQELWGGKMSTGYSDRNRKGERKIINKFDTKGITPAAGYTSTVEDLARFTSWQFRLLKNGGTEILKASTLKEMHNVQYMDPNWRTTWGLGFKVSQLDGKTFVSHSGYCPGYQSMLMINVKDQLGFVVMINAVGTDPNKYFEGMRTILAKAIDCSLGIRGDDNLEDYCGLYGAKPWGGEMIVTPWGDKLALLTVPNDNPKYITLIKPVSKNTFRVVREDGELGEDVIFERDKTDNVVKVWRNSNYKVKMK